MGLELAQLNYSVGGQHIIGPLNWHIPSGARYCLMAANGAGKTTLLNLLSGLLRASQAGDGQDFLPTCFQSFLKKPHTILWQGKNITSQSIEARWKSGIRRNFQSHQLFMSLSLRQHLTLAAPSQSMAAEYLQRFERISVTAKIDSLARADLPLEHLAYADQKWLALALAVINLPVAPHESLLLLDEPFAGVSGAIKKELCELLLNLPSTCTLILVEHDVLAARQVTQRAAILARGQIVWDDSWDTLSSSPLAVREAAAHYSGVRALLADG